MQLKEAGFSDSEIQDYNLKEAGFTDYEITDNKKSTFTKAWETYTEGLGVVRQEAREIIFKEPRRAETIGEYIIKTIPESALRLSYGVPAFIYETGKEMVKPIKERVTGEYPFAETTTEKIVNATKEEAKAVTKAVIGIIDFIGTYTGAKDIAFKLTGFKPEDMKYLSPTTFKEAWYTEPAGGLLAITPIAKGILKRSKFTGKPIKQIETEIKEQLKITPEPEKVISDVIEGVKPEEVKEYKTLKDAGFTDKEIKDSIKAKPIIETKPEEFLKPTEIPTTKVKPTEPELPLGAEKEALKGMIPTEELPETALESATREAETRKIETEMAERQVVLPEGKAFDLKTATKGDIIKFANDLMKQRGKLKASELAKELGLDWDILPEKQKIAINEIIEDAAMYEIDINKLIERKEVLKDYPDLMPEEPMGIPITEGKELRPDIVVKKTIQQVEQTYNERKLRQPTLSELQGDEGYVDIGVKEKGYDLREKVKPKDINPMSEWIMSPEFIAKDYPIAREQIAKTVEAHQRFVFEHEANMNLFNDLKYPLNKEEMKLVGKVAEGKATSNNPKVNRVASEIRYYFDDMKEQIKDYKRVMYRKYLSKSENEAIDRVLSGEDIKSVSKEMGIEPEILTDIISDYRAIDRWGIENFVTHIERGIYRFVDEKGTTVLVGVTKKDAIRKAESYLNTNPDVKTLWLDTEFSAGVEFPTKLTKGQYHRLKRRLQSEFAEDAETIQKILHERGSIVTIKPTQKFAGPMLKRYDILRGEENIFDILPAYDYIMTKKINLDPILADARMEVWKLPTNIRDAMLNYLDDIKGRKTIGDKFVDSLMEKIGVGTKPFILSSGIAKIRTGVTWAKLGYRPIAGIINLASGQSHTWTKTGVEYIGKAIKLSNSKEGKILLENESPYLGLSFAQEATKVKRDVPLWHPLGMFQKPEIPNRKISYLANYLIAKEKLGFKEATAREFARRSVRFQQFTYDIASLPKMMRGPMGKLVLQFKPYLIKELEFISTLRGPEIPRYIAMQLALAGPRGTIYTLKTLPILGALGLLDDAEDWMNKHLPKVSRGMGGLLGVDVTAPATFQFPTSPEELAGPFIGDLLKLYKNVYVPFANGESYLAQPVKKWGKGLIPAFYYWDMIVDSVMDEEGWIKNESGQRVHKATNWDKVKLAFGAKPLELSSEELAVREIKREEQVEKNTRVRIIDEINNLRLKNKAISDGLIQDAYFYGVIRWNEDRGGWDFSSISKDMEEKHLTPRQRLMLRITRKNRYKLMQQQ